MELFDDSGNLLMYVGLVTDLKVGVYVELQFWELRYFACGADFFILNYTCQATISSVGNKITISQILFGSPIFPNDTSNFKFYLIS